MTRMKDVNIDATLFIQERGEEPRGLAVWGFRPADAPSEVGEEPFEFYGTYTESAHEAKKHFAKLNVVDIEIAL